MASPEPTQEKRRPPRTSQEHVVEWLRDAVTSRRLQPGQRVGQEEIAEQVGVSIVPVREALRVLEQEGQLTYRPRRGHFVTELRVEDLEEIYGLREIMEERAVRYTLSEVGTDVKDRLVAAAEECRLAAEARDVFNELRANREFHFSLMDAPGRPHTLRIIQKLWDQTEAYRALYYNVSAENEVTVAAHDRIVAATLEGDMDLLIFELNRHRNRALEVLRGILIAESE
ncbi:MAG: GntR family transcriptional regulator [Actinomycetota bacterium]|nr:GntR family transcriptional regulator [Actinomycetota bacterium]